MYATVGIFELIKKFQQLRVGFISAATDSSHCCFVKHSLRLFRPTQFLFGALVGIGILELEQIITVSGCAANTSERTFINVLG